MSDILKVYKTELAWSLLNDDANGKDKGVYHFDLILLDDYSVMGLIKGNFSNPCFLFGVNIPDIGFLFTALNLNNKNSVPVTYTAAKQLNGSPDTYYGMIQYNCPQGDINAGNCVIKATPKQMSPYDLDNYIDEIANVQDMLDGDNSSFVAQYYDSLLSEETASQQVIKIGNLATYAQNNPVSSSDKRIETMLSK